MCGARQGKTICSREGPNVRILLPPAENPSLLPELLSRVGNPGFPRGWFGEAGGPWLFRSPVSGSDIRRLDGEAVGGRRLARTPTRGVARWLAASTRHRLQRSL